MPCLVFRFGFTKPNQTLVPNCISVCRDVRGQEMGVLAQTQLSPVAVV